MGLNLTHTCIFVLRSVGAFSVLLGGLCFCDESDRRFRLSKVGVATAENLWVDGEGDLMAFLLFECMRRGGDPFPTKLVEPEDTSLEIESGERGILVVAIELY